MISFVIKSMTFKKLKNHIQLFFVIILMIFFNSCKPKPQPNPMPVKVLKKPDWIDGKRSDINQWFGVGIKSSEDSIASKTKALSIIRNQIKNDIKKTISYGIDSEKDVIDSISNEILISRYVIINNLIKEIDYFKDGQTEFSLLSLNKKEYKNEILERFRLENFYEVFDQITDTPTSDNFSILSKNLKNVVSFLDIIFDRNISNENNNARLLYKYRTKVKAYMDRLGFYFSPKLLNTIPISNDNQEVIVDLIDEGSGEKIDSFMVSMSFDSVRDPENWISNKMENKILILPEAIENHGYIFTIGVDYNKFFSELHLKILNVIPKRKKITVIPRSVTIYTSESIVMLGTGIDNSKVYDSIKNCFSQSFFSEFVSDSSKSDILLNFEISTNGNMRRTSRKTPFKSEALFILSLKNRKTKKIIFSQPIATSEVTDYDFIERAGVRALQNLVKKASNAVCN